jgi:hypothetical protein
MGNLYNALNGLKTNIFGGGNTGKTTPILRKHAVGMDSTSPTSAANGDPFAFSSISYPRNQVNDYTNGHYILFYVNIQEKSKYEYNGFDKNGKSVSVGGVTQVNTYQAYDSARDQGVGPQTFDNRFTNNQTSYISNDGSNNAKYFEDAVTKGAFKGNITSLKSGDTVKLAKSKKARSTGLAANSNPTRRITDSVALYLPPNVQDSTVAAYNTDATGALGFAAAGGMDILRKFNQNDMAGASSALINLAKGFLGNTALKAGAEAADLFSGGSGGAGLINKFFSQADNPYLEVLFDKMNLRNFSYTFTLAPKNTDERDDIQRIIQLFRFHMSPEVISENNRFLRLPSEFDIHYMYQHKSGQASENDYYNKIATCVMTGCDVDYTPNGVNSFDDGSPTKMTMKLEFTELEMLTKEKVNEGF